MLVAFGFSMAWVNWIMNLISSTFFSVLVNGVPSGIITPTRGIRQGDPLSPFLLILIAEGLGWSISASKEANSIRGLRGTPDGASHSHQQFVDDTMLMGYPFVQEASSFRKCLDQFGSASGLEFNAQKSKVFFFNTPSITHRNIFRILGFSKGFLPATFLGTPLINT